LTIQTRAGEYENTYYMFHTYMNVVVL
jgi:hypothetical protein